MKRNRWLFLIILVLIAIIILFAFLLEHREAQLASVNPPPIEEKEASGQEVSGEEPGQAPQVVPGEVLAVEERILEPSFSVSLTYDKYLTTYTYFFVGGDSAIIRSGPSSSYPILRRAAYGERLDYLESVYIAAEDGSTEQWHHIIWEEEGEKRFGFVHGSEVTERLYQFDKMEEAVLKAEAYAERGDLTYISNYQNRNGYAPLYKGQAVDGEGNRRSQSAPGYPSLSDMSNFLYLGDGTLVRYHFPSGDYARVEVVASGERYYVPKKFIPKDHRIHDLKKVIVIDVTNQNEAVYEKIEGTWTLISYTQATTGKIGRYSQPTPTGFYFAMESRSYFRYYEDGTTRIQGYAPYAIRFAGGAYIHGVPVNYKYLADGTQITPPTQEYSKTIGTVPLSHKCVRNYTSHAKFLYDWFTPGETVVIVID
ncbi:MAG: L,D-transpeptidase family protein [Anaerovoracaceae bacterium]|jgi:lipoprotein-anchoring transpeptidase ErfK/SrfK